MSIKWNTLKTADQLNAEAAAKKATEIRNKRDQLLRECDFYTMPDYPLEKKPKNLKRYREALRDITNQPGFPNDVTWPEL